MLFITRNLLTCQLLSVIFNPPFEMLIKKTILYFTADLRGLFTMDSNGKLTKVLTLNLSMRYI